MVVVSAPKPAKPCVFDDLEGEKRSKKNAFVFSLFVSTHGSNVDAVAARCDAKAYPYAIILARKWLNFA
ncbi:hypothetical protein KUV73_18740 [Mameliella alba]|nr:hypothetical protein [Mameliella alba]MBY6176416.1 hypothetical protein [Mameliella alba]